MAASPFFAPSGFPAADPVADAVQPASPSAPQAVPDSPAARSHMSGHSGPATASRASSFAGGDLGGLRQSSVGGRGWPIGGPRHSQRGSVDSLLQFATGCAQFL